MLVVQIELQNNLSTLVRTNCSAPPRVLRYSACVYVCVYA